MEAEKREAIALEIAKTRQQEKELAEYRRTLTKELAEYYLHGSRSAREHFTHCFMEISRPTTYKLKKNTNPYELLAQVPSEVLDEVFKVDYKVSAERLKFYLTSWPILRDAVEIKDGSPQIKVEVDE